MSNNRMKQGDASTDKSSDATDLELSEQAVIGEMAEPNERPLKPYSVSDTALPKFQRVDENSVSMMVGNSSSFLEAFGTKSERFAEVVALGLGGLSNDTKNLEAPNAAIAMMAEIGPRDGLEAMLASQMAAVHIATMKCAGHLMMATNLKQQDAHERAVNKLARTFAAQVEALRKHRTGGEQKVTVEHVTVNDGGQAIVGEVQMGGRKDK